VPRLVGLNHLAVEVGDLDEALAFFERIFDDVRLRGRSGHMAFVDMGDQFIALERTQRGQTPGRVADGHIGLVVDDRAETVRRAQEAGANILGDHDVLDPWGNRWQIVDYRDIQFSKTPRVLEGMGLPALVKSEKALAELRAAGLAD
jgi:predicted enzyme related to lactoylglutathione lyase